MSAVEAVATAPGPVVFHCYGGKDRTGLVAAILLRLAGVPAEVIAEDYALSAVRLEPRHRRWIADAQDEAERARIERITATPGDAMRAFSTPSTARYGGVDRYLLDGGLAPEVLEAARSRLR